MEILRWIVRIATFAIFAGAFAPLYAQPVLNADEAGDDVHKREAGTLLSLRAWSGDPAEPAIGTVIVFSGSAGAVTLNLPLPDPCKSGEVFAVPTRPTWDSGAATTRCGVVETDMGWQYQPMGGGVSQKVMTSSLRYGLTARLDIRWGMVDHIYQSGGKMAAVQGTGDQTFGFRYRFHEQGRLSPALAVAYDGKVPLANAAKGLGTGFVDHQLLLIASRDAGKVHLDGNAAATIAGAARGNDGALLAGIAASHPFTGKLTGILESYGGTQPGTTERFGAVFAGAAYSLRTSLVLDAGYSYTFTPATPKAQVLIGITYARRPGFGSLSKSLFRREGQER